MTSNKRKENNIDNKVQKIKVRKSKIKINQTCQLLSIANKI